MQVDAIQVAGSNEWSAAGIASAVRAALSCVRERIHSVRVEVRRSGDGHVCRLQARAERGQVVVVECRAALLGQAIESAADGLEVALETPTGTRQAASLRPRLLLAAPEQEVASNSLRWVALLGNALQADLDFYRPAARGAVSGRGSAARGELRGWCELAMPHAVLSERMISSSVNFMAAVGSLARSRGVEWIVMPAHDSCGAAAVGLARTARCPVLVARAPTTNSVLLLATQAHQDHYPALKGAARLALPLRSPVLVLHDIANLPDTARLSAQVDALAGPWALLQRECQGGHAGQRLPCIDILLARGGDRVAGVLDQARREDANLIIVSLSDAEPCSPSARFAEAVVARALRSVLVLPGAALGGADRRLTSPGAPCRSRAGEVERVRRVQPAIQVRGRALGTKRKRPQLPLLPRWPRGLTSGGPGRR